MTTLSDGEPHPAAQIETLSYTFAPWLRDWRGDLEASITGTRLAFLGGCRLGLDYESNFTSTSVVRMQSHPDTDRQLRRSGTGTNGLRVLSTIIGSHSLSHHLSPLDTQGWCS